MKKIIFSLLAVAALASCAKTDAVYEDSMSEIKIKPTAALATKANVLAAIDGTEYPVKENFDVYAYWANEPAGSNFTEGSIYLGIDGPAVEFKNKGNYWGGVTTYYWPKNGSLRFAAYSPSSVDMTHNLATDTYTVNAYTQPATTDATWDLLVAPTSESYTSMTAAENVSVVFEHALSWITVKVVAKDAEAAKAFDIKKVTINDVVNVADLSAVMSGADKAFNWALSETKVPYEIFNGSQAVTESATVIETVKDGTIIIPQPTTTITVDYTQNALAGTPALENQSVTVDLVLDTNNTPWEPGKHYVYTLVFGLDEILINPDVVDWEDVEVGEIDTDKTAVNVSTPEQLVAAIKANAKVVLQNDIKLSEILVIDETNVVLDGNGFTLTSSAPRAINVDGPVAVTIKDLTIEASGERAINVINGAARVTIDNVTATAANYALNLATSATGAEVGVDNSDLTGLNVVNVAAAESKVTLVNTNLTNTDANTAEAYAAIAFYNTAINAKVFVRGCHISVADDSYAGSEGAYGASMIIDEETTGNTQVVKMPYCIIYPDQTAYAMSSFAEALETAKDGETIVLVHDVTETITVDVDKKITLDLNGKNISTEGDAIVVSAGELTITGEGVVYAATTNTEPWCAVWAHTNGKVNIEGGEFKVGYPEGDYNDLIYAKDNAVINISGGRFYNSGKVGAFVLNLKDNSNAVINVTGGKFEKFNPAENASENPQKNFVIAGTVEQDGDWYIVK